MSKCDLEIVLDHPDRPYKPGEKLSGFVGVTVNTDCKCNGLTIASQWRTHGSGNNRSGPNHPTTLFEGEWKAGEQHVHPFELTVPNGPLTYHGQYLNVDWYLTARADIPWALDPKAKTEFVLVDDPSVPALDHGPLQKTGATSASGVASGAVAAIMLGVFAFAGVFMCVGFGSAFHGDWVSAIPFAIVPVLFAGVALFVLSRFLRNVLASRRLGEVEFTVGPDHVRGGDTLNVRLRMTPRTEVKLDAVRARLHAQERCTSGSGTNSHTYTHSVWDETVHLRGPGTLKAGVPIEITGQVQMPPNPAPSFAASDEYLHWKVEVILDAAGWLDWTRAWELAVRP